MKSCRNELRVLPPGLIPHCVCVNLALIIRETLRTKSEHFLGLRVATDWSTLGLGLNAESDNSHEEENILTNRAGTETEKSEFH